LPALCLFLANKIKEKPEDLKPLSVDDIMRDLGNVPDDVTYSTGYLIDNSSSSIPKGDMNTSM